MRSAAKPLASKASLLAGRRTRADSARTPKVSWMPLSVSQNRLAAVVGEAKESSIFGSGRLWKGKDEFEDALRLILVQESIHEVAQPLGDAAADATTADRTISEKQAMLTDLVRVASGSFVATIASSQTFHIGMSARSGIAATPTERDLAAAGQPSALRRIVRRARYGSGIQSRPCRRVDQHQRNPLVAARLRRCDSHQSVLSP